MPFSLVLFHKIHHDFYETLLIFAAQYMTALTLVTVKLSHVLIFFKEVEKDVFRVSLRSKDKGNAASIAEYFGGGGHIHAAGFTASGNYEKLLKEIPELIDKLLKKNREKQIIKKK